MVNQQQSVNNKSPSEPAEEQLLIAPTASTTANTTVDVPPATNLSSLSTAVPTVPSPLLFHFAQNNITNSTGSGELLSQMANNNSTSATASFNTTNPTIVFNTTIASFVNSSSPPATPITEDLTNWNDDFSDNNNNNGVDDDGLMEKPVDLAAIDESGGELMMMTTSKEKTWESVLLGATFSNTLILLLLLLLTKGKSGCFGIRLYTLNLAIFALIQMVIMAWTQPDDVFGLHTAVSFGVRDFLNKYNGPLLEWSQIVYLSATTVLMLDCIQKYRNKNNNVVLGISKMSWLLGLAFLDILPLIYIFVKGIRFEYIQIQPKPLAIYHVVVLLLFLVVSIALGCALFCLPFCQCCRRGRSSRRINGDGGGSEQNAGQQQQSLRNRPKFWAHNRTTTDANNNNNSYAKLTALFAFVVLTGWTQLTVFNLGIDLQPPGGVQRAKQIAQQQQQGAIDMASDLLKTVQEKHIVYWLMSIQQWSAHFRPFLETMLAILLLLIPSIDRKFQMRKSKLCFCCLGRTVHEEPTLHSFATHQNQSNGILSTTSDEIPNGFGHHQQLGREKEVATEISVSQIASAPPQTL